MNINQERLLIISSRFGMNGDRLTKLLEDIQRRVLENKEKIIKENPSWDITNDARILTLVSLFTSLGRTRLGIHLLGELCDDEWFDRNSPNSNHLLRIDQAVSFEKLIKYNFGMDFFTTTESFFRILMRTLGSKEAQIRKRNYKEIYEYLLSPELLNFADNDLKFALEILNLARLLRNLIHNGGVYYLDVGKSETAIYKEKSYTFIHGTSPDFVYWKLLIEMAVDIRKLLIKVISHPKIISITHIQDPNANLYWNPTIERDMPAKKAP